jgi:hypothetical protein
MIALAFFAVDIIAGLGMAYTLVSLLLNWSRVAEVLQEWGC